MMIALGTNNIKLEINPTAARSPFHVAKFSGVKEEDCER
jgi:hypothetical protein